MEAKKFWDKSTGKIFILAFVLGLILLYFQRVIGVLALIGVGIAAYYRRYEIQADEAMFQRHMEDLSVIFDTATKHAIFNMPFPLVILEPGGGILWYNTPFIDMAKSDKLMGQNIEDLVVELDLEKFYHEDRKGPVVTVYHGKSYQVYGSVIDLRKSQLDRDEILVLYWVDNTENVLLHQRIQNESVSVIMVEVDNYDEVKNNTPDMVRPLVLAEIDKLINGYFNDYHALVRKYENDKYQIVIENVYLRELIARRFDILDELRELSKGNNIPITLSLGVSSMEVGVLEAFKEARASLEVALGRGGDQAVLRQENGYQFFGGKTKAVEKRNKVKSRVIADALRQLIDHADRALIMGHSNPDMDAIGAAIGMWRAVSNRKKEAYIVLNQSNPSIDHLVDKLQREENKLGKYIVNSEEAEALVKKDTLLIMVDNHKPSFSEEPKLVKMINQIVVIDHHRRGTEFVENAVLTYIEPYASSTCELVTEILTYIGENHHLTPFEAEALMAGIMVDTKDFSFQTGVRTFEAASTLKRAGADMGRVKQLFRDDLETIKQKSEVVRTAKIYRSNIAIGTLNSMEDDSILVAAKAADELLYINDVMASFVLAKIEEGVIHISGRSLGTISVQLILESLGGGGHLTSAGVQLKEESLAGAERRLIKAIDQYIEEGKEKREGNSIKGR